MDAALISSLSVLGGSLVGALTSLASTWVTQAHQDRRELLSKRIADRETLYANFISEASRAQVDSLEHSLERIDCLVPLYVLVGHTRLSSSEPVITCAEKVMREIAAGYCRPYLTRTQFGQMALGTQGREHADPLAEFSNLCRQELRNMTDGFSLHHKRRQSTRQKPPDILPVGTHKQ
jgi:hypothetical protein